MPNVVEIDNPFFKSSNHNKIMEQEINPFR